MALLSLEQLPVTDVHVPSSPGAFVGRRGDRYLNTEECDISGISKVIALEFLPRTNSLSAVSCKSTSFDD